MESQQQRLAFLRWLQNNSHEDVKSSEQYFNNLRDPLQYLKDKNMQKLENNLLNTRDDIKGQMSHVQQFSKSIYKKVITRNNLDFDQLLKDLNSTNNDHDDSWINRQGTYHKNKQVKKKVKNQDAKNYHFETLYSNEDDNLLTASQKPLTINEIKLLDTPQFASKCKNVQFYDLFTTAYPSQKNRGALFSFSELESLEAIMEKFEFNLIDKDQSLLDEKSHMVPFKCQRQMRFWKTNLSTNNNTDPDLEILGECFNMKLNNPNCSDLLDLASAFVNADELFRFNQIKKNHQVDKKLNQNNQNLQKKYQKVKLQLQYFKDTKLRSKAPRMPIKYADNYAQTLNQLQQASFSDQIQQNIQTIELKLKQMKEYRDKALIRQEKQTTRIMLININEQIRCILLDLLCYLINNSGISTANQTITSYEQLIKLDNKKEAERTILDFIHKNYLKFQNQEIQGRKKIELIDLYLRQRRQCQKFIEILDKRWN